MNGLLNKKDRSRTCIYMMLCIFIIISVICLNCNNVETGLRPVSAMYIDFRAGDDNNPGTIKKPIKTISELNDRIQNNPANIYFAGGQVFEGTLLLKDIQGNDSVPIIIGSYGEGRAVINGGNKESIRIKNSKNIRINNLGLKGSGRKEGNTTNGLQLVNSTGCVVEDIRAEGFQKSGVDLYNCRDVKVLKVIAYANGFCGINIMGSHQDSSEHILIKDCKAENNPGDPTILDNHSGNGILVGVSDSVIIDHCTATNNGWDMPRQGNGPVGIWTWQSDHVTIQYCISYRNKTSKGGKDGGGFDLDGGVTNSLVQYCLSYENEGAGYGLFQYWGASDWSDNVIRYCVSLNDARTTEGAGSFFIWNGSNESKQLTNCYIYNNVAISTSAPVVSFENASEHENFVFSNNIFLGSDKMISGKNSGSKFPGNVWRSITDPVLNGPFVTDITDPYKLNTLEGFKLQSGSSLRNSGVKIKSMYGFDPPLKDFFGNPVPQGSAPEPGIYELE
jgi:hypothetical protein